MGAALGAARLAYDVGRSRYSESGDLLLEQSGGEGYLRV